MEFRILFISFCEVEGYGGDVKGGGMCGVEICREEICSSCWNGLGWKRASGG